MAIEGTERNSTLVAVDWPRLFPWLLLFRSFRVAASASVLLIGTAGVWASFLGWSALEYYFSVEGDDPRHSVVDTTGAGLLANSAGLDPSTTVLLSADGKGGTDEMAPLSARSARATELLGMIPRSVARPWGQILFRRLTWTQLAYYLLGTLWNLAVWGFAAGVITRIAVVRLGRSERVGLMEAVRYVVRRPAYFAAPLVPQIAFLSAALLGIFAGWLMRLSFGALLVAVCWPLVIVFGLLSAVIALGLAVGWPFLWVVPSAEKNGDAFEATQRSFSYSWERPLHYLFYAIVAAAYGWACILLVSWFVDAVVHFSWWSVAWGLSWSGIDELVSSPDGVMSISGKIIGFWNTLVTSAAAGFAAAYFWTAFSAIYLLLRRVVDEGMPVEEVYMPDEIERFQLPLSTAGASANHTDGQGE